MANNDDGVEVEWSCLEVDGIPTLVVQTTGPVLSGKFMDVDCQKLQLGYIIEPDKEPLFVCFSSSMEPENAILACDPDPILKPLGEAYIVGLPWMLLLQFKIEGESQSRLIRVEKDGISEIFLDRWYVQIA